MSNIDPFNRSTFYLVLDSWIKSSIEYERQYIINKPSDFYGPLLERFLGIAKETDKDKYNELIKSITNMTNDDNCNCSTRAEDSSSNEQQVTKEKTTEKTTETETSETK